MVVTSDNDGIIVPIYRNGLPFGSNFIPLTNKQIMDLLTAKKEVIEKSIAEAKTLFFIGIDKDSECHIVTKAESLYEERGLELVAAFRNGQEVSLPDATTKKGKKENAKKENKSINKTTVGTDKPENKMETTTAKKSGKKASKKVAAKKGAKKPAAKILKPKAKGALPNGKKMTITVAEALKLAKKGHMVYRASNGSPFGEYYLNLVQNKERKMDLIVRAPEK